MKKIALIGDIISSRKIKKREEIQRKVKKIFSYLNKNNEHLLSPLTITLGDEFQALYKNADSVFNHIWKITLAVYPEKIRFSLGIGDITTRINKEQAIGMDGPAFYNARQGLNEIKPTSFTFNITSEKELPLVKQSLFLISHLSYNWKETRLRILTMLNDYYSIAEIADSLKISDKAVYKNIDAGALQIIRKLNAEMISELNKSLK